MRSQTEVGLGHYECTFHLSEAEEGEFAKAAGHRRLGHEPCRVFRSIYYLKSKNGMKNRIERTKKLTYMKKFYFLVDTQYQQYN